MTAVNVTGSCLCGAVRYEIAGPFQPIARHVTKTKRANVILCLTDFHGSPVAAVDRDIIGL